MRIRTKKNRIEEKKGDYCIFGERGIMRVCTRLEEIAQKTKVGKSG
jgi:hypothetical protein